MLTMCFRMKIYTYRYNTLLHRFHRKKYEQKGLIRGKYQQKCLINPQLNKKFQFTFEKWY